ncbi:uncharacterized protein BDV17DRAFT_230737 [Aspergillus undulatus]|uniref:uncharacterized protein n=1 Tax=Aspergillus undulatus TaxID=1810928 RepID=UPI003CCD8CE6
MAPTDKPHILLLSLSHRDSLVQTYSPLFKRLSEVAVIRHVKTAPVALQVVAETTLKAIIITDEHLTESKSESRLVLSIVKDYIQKVGGLVIAGLHFPIHTRYEDFQPFFESFGLPWRCGDCYRTTFQLNPSCALPEGIKPSSLPGPYSMKVLHVKDAKPQENFFVPIPGAVNESLSLASGYMNPDQAAVAGARLGRGYLIYCGDVNGEDGTTQLILALCGF